MFDKVVVANRGAVAARVLRALAQLGIASVAVHSEADRGAPYLALAAECYEIGAAPARSSYLNQDALLDVIARSGADGVHPGYGFLSENAGFAHRVTAAGVCFIGPAAEWIDAMGHKTRARELAARYGMPMTQASGVLPVDPNAIVAAARSLGYPVLIKPAGGGGGIGMLGAHDDIQLLAGVERSRSMAARGFGNSDIYLERLMLRPRHVEFQMLADRYGNAMHLFERDCSVQRRNQKVIEEATAPGLVRTEVDGLAQRLADIVARMGYDNIGTIEMLLGADGSFNFLEMNTRLQVEHGVTEEITGVDLVHAQIRAAAGERLDEIVPNPLTPSGHAIEARIYAEDPVTFYPSPGRLDVFEPPRGAGIRVETGYAQHGEVTAHYDPMLAKVIVHAPTRLAAIDALIDALSNFEIRGLKHNISAVLAILRSEEFRAGAVHTGLISEVLPRNLHT